MDTKVDSPPDFFGYEDSSDFLKAVVHTGCDVTHFETQKIVFARISMLKQPGEWKNFRPILNLVQNSLFPKYRWLNKRYFITYNCTFLPGDAPKIENKFK